MIKQALLAEEKEQIRLFLLSNDLGFDFHDDAYFIEEDEKIIATLSLDGHIIKGLAIDVHYRGMNIAGELLSHAIAILSNRNLYSYHVFTKSIYVDLFTSMGFRLLADSGKVAFMEGGVDKIEDVILGYQKRIENTFGIKIKDNDLGTIVVNCNPMTLGHYQLIEASAAKHDFLIVFVVETDESTFTYKERFSLVYLALKPLNNVLVLPSTNYIVSKSTFPSYFLKALDEREYEHAKLDALIFKKYFMPLLNLSMRHVGTESEPVMVAYNQILKDTLGEKLQEIPRFSQNGVVISASLVRRFMYEHRIEEALSFVPHSIRPLLKAIMEEKNVRTKP
jgi:[citrate (pro-3S)-lyase] ligase